MDKRESLWEAYLARGMSRRSFLKGCVTLTSLMGLSTDNLTKVVEAAEVKPLPVVIWLHGHECTGCDESFIRSGAPLASDLVLNMIALEYSHVLSAGCGAPFEEHLEKTMEKYHGEYILAVEGGVAVGEHAYTCMSGGHSFEHTLKRVAAGAKAVVAYGTCATSGGIQAAAPNPTDSRGIRSLIGAKPYIAVPGCPPIPEVMTGVLMHVALFGTLPPLDAEGRPKQFYGNRIHDTCYRRPFFDAGMFAERYDDEGAKAGWCLYHLGCRGPETYNSCGNLRWYQGMSYPIQSGAACIGCSNANFWVQAPFSRRLPEYNGIDVDMVGAGLAVATAVGVAAHAGASLVQKRMHEKELAAHEKEVHE